MKCSKLLLVAGLICGTALATLAAPASKRPAVSPALRTTAEFSQLNPGDRIAYVCKECDSVSTNTVESKESAMLLCKEGNTVSCPACNKSYGIVRRGPAGKAIPRTEVSYVNEQGVDCMFIAKLNE